jgi:hypothetical protein
MERVGVADCGFCHYSDPKNPKPIEL